MGQMQSDMDKHSASMHESHASTRWVGGGGGGGQGTVAVFVA